MPKKIAEVAKISVNDVIDGINYLLQKGVADKNRVGFYGASFGGYITGGLASSGLDYGKCATSFAGVFDWIKQFKDWESDDPIWYGKNKHLYGDYTQQVEELNAVSPLFKADEVSIPFYLVHGKSDGRVSITQTKRYADALRQQEVSVKEEYYSWAIHGLPNETRRIEYFIKLLKFFEEHLE